MEYDPSYKNEYLKLIDSKIGTKQYEEKLQLCGGYKFIEKIGSGSYGDIYKVSKNGKEYALKKYKNTDGFDSDSLTELDILSRIHHPNVTQVKELFLDNCSPCLIMEIASMDLLNYLKIYRPDKNFQLNQLYNWMLQLVCGVNYLHINCIIHRDLKLLNILVYDNTLLIADYGMAQFVPNRYSVLPPLTQFLTTVETRAPEIWQYKEYDSRIDVWALGVIYLQLLTYHGVWDDQEYDYLDDLAVDDNKVAFNDYYDKLFNQVDIDYNIDSVINDPLLNDLLKKMLTVDREKRIYSNQIIGHPFFQNVISTMGKCAKGQIEIVPSVEPYKKYDKDRYKLWNTIYNYMITKFNDMSIWFLALDIYDRYVGTLQKETTRTNVTMGSIGKLAKNITLGDIIVTCLGLAYKLLLSDVKYNEFSKSIKEKTGIISNPDHMAVVECDILNQLDFKLFRVFKYNMSGINQISLNVLKDMILNYETVFI